MSDRILILFGTQTGNSELVAEEVGEALAEAGYDADVMDMADCVPELVGDYGLLVAVVCTWADGTFPDNAVEFWEQLQAVAPDLTGLRYGVAGLGDRLYVPYYQVAAYRLAEGLDRLGARRAADFFEIDGKPLPKDVADAQRWALQLAAAAVPTAAPED